MGRERRIRVPERLGRQPDGLGLASIDDRRRPGSALRVVHPTEARSRRRRMDRSLDIRCPFDRTVAVPRTIAAPIACLPFDLAGLPYNSADGSTIFLDGSGYSAANRTTCEMIHATIVDPEGIGGTVIPDAADSPVAASATGD